MYKLLLSTLERMKHNKEMEVDFERFIKGGMKNQFVLYQYIPSVLLNEKKYILDAFITTVSIIALHIPNNENKINFQNGNKSFMASYAIYKGFSDEHKQKIVINLLKNENDKQKFIKLLVNQILQYCSNVNYMWLFHDLITLYQYNDISNLLDKWGKEFFQKSNEEKNNE